MIIPLVSQRHNSSGGMLFINTSLQERSPFLPSTEVVPVDNMCFAVSYISAFCTEALRFPNTFAFSLTNYYIIKNKCWGFIYAHYKCMCRNNCEWERHTFSVWCYKCFRKPSSVLHFHTVSGLYSEDQHCAPREKCLPYFTLKTPMGASKPVTTTTDLYTRDGAYCKCE